MYRPGHDIFESPREPAPALASSGVYSASSAAAPSAEQAANAAAADWQIILQLKRLFARDPALVSVLLRGHRHELPVAYGAALLAGVREALADHPDSAELHYQAAQAAARFGRIRDAEALLDQALALNPCHVEALALLADVCMELNKPQRAFACLRRALEAGAVSSEAVTPVGHDRSGNELSA